MQIIRAFIVLSALIAYVGSFAADETLTVCTAACSTQDGNLDLRTAYAGPRAPSREHAILAAIEEVRSHFACSYNIELEGCSEVQKEEKLWSHSVGCTKKDGEIENQTLSLGKGLTKTEARADAYAELREKWNCPYGAGPHRFTSEQTLNQETAACLHANGKPDLRTAELAPGKTSVEAEVNALRAAYTKHKCKHGAQLIHLNK